MKTNFKNLTLIALVFLVSGLLSFGQRKNQTIEKVKILQVDSTKFYYVFNTDSKSVEYRIIIAEKAKLYGCMDSKKYVLKDSVKKSSMIRSGNGYDYIGFNSFIIDTVKVKNAGVLVKFIDNCKSLSN